MTADGQATSSLSIICRSTGLSTPSCANTSAYNLASLALISQLSVSHTVTCLPVKSLCELSASVSTRAWIFSRSSSLTADGQATSSLSIICRSAGLSTPSCANTSAYNLASLALISQHSVSHTVTCLPAKSFRELSASVSRQAWIFSRSRSLTADGQATSSLSIICRSAGLSTPSCANASAYNLASLALISQLSVSHTVTSCLPAKSLFAAACPDIAFFPTASVAADFLAAAAAAAFSSAAFAAAACLAAAASSHSSVIFTWENPSVASAPPPHSGLSVSLSPGISSELPATLVSVAWRWLIILRHSPSGSLRSCRSAISTFCPALSAVRALSRVYPSSSKVFTRCSSPHATSAAAIFCGAERFET